MRHTLSALFFAIAAFTARDAVAQPNFTLGAPAARSIDGVQVSVRPYTAAPTVIPVLKAQSSWATPEDSLVAHVSAMLAGDHAWWLSGWTTSSRLRHQEDDTKQGRTPADWQRIWDQATARQTFSLVARVDYGPYALLHFRMLGSRGETTLQSLYVCKREGGRWLATNDLATDPVMTRYFGAPKTTGWPKVK
jgi:hypothetical protein